MDFSSTFKILTINLKRNFLPHLGTALMLAFLTPLIWEISSLDKARAARPVEMLLSLAGAILLVPVFLPEQNENIRDLICSKKTDYLSICAMRVMYSIVSLAFIIGGFVLAMRFSESDVTLFHLTGGFASALFLGALGFAAAGISGNAAVGYMVSMIYYIANFSLKDKLGKFFLFSMSLSEDADIAGKIWLLFAAVLLILTTLLLTTRPRR